MLKHTDYETIEKLSEEVHNAWLGEKAKQGFHAPANCTRVKEPQKFIKYCNYCHTDMYPYNELPDNIKEYDRVTVVAVLEALNKVKDYSF